MRRITILARRYAGLIGLGLVATVLLAAASVVPASAQGTVTSGDIRNQTIRSWDIAGGGVGQSEIKEDGVDQSEIENQSIRSWNIAEGGVGTSELRNGHVFEEDLSEEVRDQLGQGPKGEKGDPGQDGQDGVSGYEVVGPEVTWTAGSTNNETTATCPDGKVAIGGGYNVDGSADPAVTIRGSGPTGLTEVSEGNWVATSWQVRGDNTDTARNRQMQVFVVCAAVN